MRDFVETLVKAIVDREDQVRLNVIESGSMIVIELRVAKEDMGKVIGREGAMVWSLRLLVSNAAARLHKRAVLEILE